MKVVEHDLNETKMVGSPVPALPIKGSAAALSTIKDSVSGRERDASNLGSYKLSWPFLGVGSVSVGGGLRHWT